MPRGRARRVAHRAGGCRTQTARDGQGSGGPRWQSRWTWRWSQRHRISLGMCLPMARPGVPRKSARAPALLPPPPNSRPGRAPGAITPQLRPSPAVPSALLLPTSPTLPWETWGPAGDPKRGGGTWSARGPRSPATPELRTVPRRLWMAGVPPAQGCPGSRKRADLGDLESPERKRLRTNPRVPAGPAP